MLQSESAFTVDRVGHSVLNPGSSGDISDLIFFLMVSRRGEYFSSFEISFLVSSVSHNILLLSTVSLAAWLSAWS